MVCRASEPASSARCLFQAVRSYLHFSQLSAWLNTTHGAAPQYIGYRLVCAIARHGCILNSLYTTTTVLRPFVRDYPGEWV